MVKRIMLITIALSWVIGPVLAVYLYPVSINYACTVLMLCTFVIPAGGWVLSRCLAGVGSIVVSVDKGSVRHTLTLGRGGPGYQHSSFSLVAVCTEYYERGECVYATLHWEWPRYTYAEIRKMAKNPFD